jgi:hypothetical protein
MPQSNVSTRYPSGGAVVTQSNAPAYYGGDNDLLDFYNNMARRRRAAAPASAPMAGGMRTTRTPPPAGSSREGSGGVDLLKEKLLKAQLSQEKAKARAVSGRAPLRTSFVGGQMVVTPDSNAMTGAQRQVFLPQNSIAPEQGMFHGTDPGIARRPPPTIGGHDEGYKTVYGAAGLDDEYTPSANPEYQAFLAYKAEQERKAREKR